MELDPCVPLQETELQLIHQNHPPPLSPTPVIPYSVLRSTCTHLNFRTPTPEKDLQYLPMNTGNHNYTPVVGASPP